MTRQNCHSISPALALFLTCCLPVSFLGCGKNILSSSEPADPAEDSTIALEDNNPTKAIKILSDALSDDPENPQYLSLLAMAHAQRAEIDVLTLAEKMGSNASSDSSALSGNEITAMFSIMPEASDANLSDIDLAVSLLTSIPADKQLSGDTFKLAIYQTASLVLHTKALDIDGDGVLSPEEIAGLSGGGAQIILSQLISAEATLGGDGTSDLPTAGAAEALAKVQQAIAATPGATDDERLRNYLATQKH